MPITKTHYHEFELLKSNFSTKNTNFFQRAFPNNGQKRSLTQNRSKLSQNVDYCLKTPQKPAFGGQMEDIEGEAPQSDFFRFRIYCLGGVDLQF